MRFFNLNTHGFYSRSFLLLRGIGWGLCGLFLVNACDTPESVQPYQGQNFIKLYGGNGIEEGMDLIALSDGGFVLTGSSTSTSNGGKDVYVVRTDNLGNVIWEKSYGGRGDDVGNSVLLGQNNSIYVCGEITQDTSDLPGTRDVYVLNLNLSDGSVIGEPKQYGNYKRDEFGSDVIEMSDGKFFITSTMAHQDTSKYYLIETDNNLDTLQFRSRYIGTEQVNNYATKTFENSLDMINPYVIFGSVQRIVNGNKSFWYRSFVYRSNGDATINPEFYGSETEDEICSDAFKTTDGGYILAGTSTVGNQTREMVVRLNPNREEVWKKTYNNSFNRNVKESGIIQTNDGGYLLSSTIELNDPKNHEISLLKLNAEGIEEWRKTYGSSQNDKGSKVVQLEDGSFVVVGTMGFEINPNSQTKMCLIKVNEHGDLVPLD